MGSQTGVVPRSAIQHRPTAGPALPSERSRSSAVDRFRNWAPSPTVATATIIGTSIAYSSVSFFARRLTDAGIAPATVAFARFAMIVVVLGRFLRLDREVRSATIWGVGTGAAMAVGWIAYVHAIDIGSVASAGVIYMSYPLFALAAMLILFGVRPNRRQLIGGLIVLAAATITLGFSTDIAWIVVVTPATFGTSIAVLTERLGPLDPFSRIAAVGLGATITLTPLLFGLDPSQIFPTTASGWSWLLGLALGSTLIPMTVYACAAPRIGAARASVAGAVELPAVFVVGSVFLGESLGATEMIAAVLICVAVVITPATRPAHARAGEASELDQIITTNPPEAPRRRHAVLTRAGRQPTVGWLRSQASDNRA